MKRIYCNTDEHHEHRYLSQKDAIKLYLMGRKPHLKCDKELVQEVLFDAVVTAPLEAYWTRLALNKNPDKGVEIAFLGTRTGLSRTNLFVVPEQLSNQDFLAPDDKEGVFNADHFPLWYKRAAEQVPGTFIYSIPFSSGGTENKSVVLASTAIQLLDDRKSPIVAALGIQMKLDFFQKKFWTASRQNINCYLIDNNGFILVAQDSSQPYLAFIAAVKWLITELVMSFVIQQIPSSNLFMVVVDNKCDCSSAPPVTMEPFSFFDHCEHNESLKCERLKNQKDRKRPDSCHPYHPEVPLRARENAMECGRGVGLDPQPPVTLLALLCVLLAR
ncbi:hypothetical protein JZ751_010809 [Albula glossodonta]|uniref:Voltage-dependent calcium channel alpha-2/delta subunit conserved region domain-containing protein n=1 Tax=Albula glossodonta TaxID=121402 RepID=A0A8T2N0K2_9TELE|nr:hypothetical protein JZ751_010809 [Albula glossodonta]